jgi:hypothetical protein
MHSRPVATGRGFWWTDRLWVEAAGLPPRKVAIDQIPEFDRNCWFSEDLPPTCRAIAEHVRRINSADLQFPIVLAADGGLMDGGHRLAKAWLGEMTHISAVQFDRDPEPDWIEAAGTYMPFCGDASG